MEPPQSTVSTKQKMVINSARGPLNGTYSERDPSNEPLKGM